MTNDEKKLLVQVSTDICWLKKIMGNHLKHHWAVTLAVTACALSTTGSVIIVLVCSF